MTVFVGVECDAQTLQFLIIHKSFFSFNLSQENVGTFIDTILCTMPKHIWNSNKFLKIQEILGAILRKSTKKTKNESGKK